MTFITYTGNFKYIAVIFWSKEQKLISQGGNHPPTANFDSLPFPYPSRVVKNALKGPDRMIPQLVAVILMVELSVLAGRKINFKGVVTTPFGRRGLKHKYTFYPLDNLTKTPKIMV